MTPNEALASLSTEQLDALLAWRDVHLWNMLYNEQADRGYIALMAAAAAPSPDDQLTDDETADDIDRLLNDDA